MKQSLHFIIGVIMFLLPQFVFASVNDDKTVTYPVSLNGTSTVDMKFVITGDNTCEVAGTVSGYSYTACIDPNTTGNIELPAVVEIDGNNYAITSIGDGAFYNCTNVNRVDLSKTSITKIGDDAFYNTGLTSVGDFNISGISFGRKVFSGCLKLTEIDIPDSWTSIPIGAFSNCTNLTKVTGGKNVTRIENVISKNRYDYPKSGDGGFDGCTNLSDVSALANVTYIGARAFYGTAIPSADIFQKADTIGWSAFQGCKNIKELHVPSSVKVIGRSSFSSCDLVYADLGENVDSIINESAFSGNVNLKYVRMHSNFKSVEYDYSLIGEGKFESSAIGFGIFNGDKNLECVDMLDAKADNILSYNRGEGSSIRERLAPFYKMNSWKAIIYLPKGTAYNEIYPNYVATDADGNLVCSDFQYFPTADPIFPHAFNATKTTINGRTLTANATTTICVPFTIDNSKSSSGARFFEYVPSEDAADAVSFREVKTTELGKAYLVIPSSDHIGNVSVGEMIPDQFKQAAANAIVKKEGASEENGFKGVSTSTKLTGTYYVFDGTNFVKKTNPTIAPTEAYLEAGTTLTAETLSVKLEDLPAEVNPDGAQIKIDDSGWATFCSTDPVDYTPWEAQNVKAYVITGLEADNTTNSVALVLTRVKSTQAGVGVVLVVGNSNGAYSSVDPVTLTVNKASGLVSSSLNMLVGVLKQGSVAQTADNGNVNFFLARADSYSDKIFYKVPSDGVTFPAGLAYLSLSAGDAANVAQATASGKQLGFIFNDGDATGIDGVKDNSSVNDQNVYDLSGRFVGTSLNSLRPGLYLRAGKKVVVK